jgi:hypothetical protein
MHYISCLLLLNKIIFCFYKNGQVLLALLGVCGANYKSWLSLCKRLFLKNFMSRTHFICTFTKLQSKRFKLCLNERWQLKPVFLWCIFLYLLPDHLSFFCNLFLVHDSSFSYKSQSQAPLLSLILDAEANQNKAG